MSARLETALFGLLATVGYVYIPARIALACAVPVRMIVYRLKYGRHGGGLSVKQH
jgi:hypothetical protein